MKSNLNPSIHQSDEPAILRARILELEARVHELESKPVVLPFSVSIGKMTESHQVTYHVILENIAQRHGLMSYDSEGRIVPYVTEDLENAKIDAQEWAEFLGVELTPYLDSEQKKTRVARP